MSKVSPLSVLLLLCFVACTSLQIDKATNSSTSTPSIKTQDEKPTEHVNTIQSDDKVEINSVAPTLTVTPLNALPSPTPLGYYKDEITWHPQEILLSVVESANDGNPWRPKWPLLRLYWDGTIIQGDGDKIKIAHMSQAQMCRLFNSITQTGWFNVDYLDYSPVFAGTWAELIGIYLWQERNGGGYLFADALQGAGARETMFCGDCIKTKRGNFIPAAEANTYYLLFNNFPTNFRIEDNFTEPGAVPVDYKITCQISDGTYPFAPVDHEAEYVIFSSNGQKAIGVLNQNSANTSSAIYKNNGSKQYFSYNPYSFGAETLTITPRLWAKDNQFIYLSIYPNNIDPQPFHEAVALQQIDSNTGQTRYLFQGQANEFYSYELSDTGSRLAYIKQNQNPFELVILDIATNTEIKLTIESPDIPASYYRAAGGLKFNFELDKLFFTAIHDQLTLSPNCDAPNDTGLQNSTCTTQNIPTTTFFMVDLLNPTKLYTLDQRSGEYKINRISYSSEYSKWMEICSINKGLTDDDYCSGDYIDLP